METGSELSKTVATFIVQKILHDDTGLDYICQAYERFYAVTTVLNNMVAALVKSSSPQRLLKHVIRCYIRLADNRRARDALKPALPEPFRDGSFDEVLKEDNSLKQWLGRLMMQLNEM